MSDQLHALEARLHALWIQALDGDARAYREVLHQLGQHVRGFLRRRMTMCPQDVEDVVQEVILAIHLKRQSYLASQPLTAWVHAIARYKLIDHLRSRRHELAHEDIDDWTDFLVSRPAVVSGDAVRQVEEALATLPAKQRQAIECTRLEGLSLEQTAEKTGQSLSAVKSNIHRGLKLLAARYVAH